MIHTPQDTVLNRNTFQEEVHGGRPEPPAAAHAATHGLPFRPQLHAPFGRRAPAPANLDRLAARPRDTRPILAPSRLRVVAPAPAPAPPAPAPAPAPRTRAADLGGWGARLGVAAAFILVAVAVALL